MRRAALLLMLGSLATACGTAIADEALQRETLRGLKSVCVFVTMDDDVSSYVLNPEPKTRIELRLRKNGVPVASEAEYAVEDLVGGLSSVVTAVPSSDHLQFAISAELELGQAVWRVRGLKPTRLMVGRTWSTGQLLLFGRATLESGKLGEVLDALTDEFINAWLATHPSPPRIVETPTKP